VLFDQTVSATPHVLSGGVKPIAVTALRRSPSLPDVPTSVEAGLAELQTIAWGTSQAKTGDIGYWVARLKRAMTTGVLRVHRVQ
jgi:tripartite-type tricarboxylate transporter receptor subunit TctC